MKNQNNRLFKDRGEKSELKTQLSEMLEKFDADEVLKALVDCSRGTTDEEYLKDEAISYLNIYHGMNVVKLQGLTQQMQFEEAINQIIPYGNDKQAQLFTA